MSYNGRSGSHWQGVAWHFCLDLLLFGLGFYLATYLRLASSANFAESLGGLAIGAFVFPSAAYILGLYAFEEIGTSFSIRCLALVGCQIIAFVFMAIYFYFTLSFDVGRGIMGLGFLISFLLILPHHLDIHCRWTRKQETIAFVLLDEDDVEEFDFLQKLKQDRLILAGVFTDLPEERVPDRYVVLGTLDQAQKVVDQEKIDLLVCTGRPIASSAAGASFRQLRYSGVQLIPAVAFCEEAYKFVPLRLVNDLWLYNASISPHSFYIRKLKRAFDIVGSIIGLVLFSPVLALGLLAVRLGSPGPLFYQQVRSGRNGVPFKVLKLRTMRVDAEKNGAVWASGPADPRLTRVGGFLRKYRIDEIPQFINVLKGEMSFVGPRPERPEMIGKIAQKVLYFPERLMVSPGITGWAQVNYPYGASITDAAHKLEYDLYYMKHMNIFLDILILLDTVRLILRGGLGASQSYSRHWLEVSRTYASWEVPTDRTACSVAPSVAGES